MSKDCLAPALLSTAGLKVMSDFIVDFYEEQRRIDDPKNVGFPEKPFKPTRVFPGTVNIKK